jgi:tetratricopeptide (TPR) repeat protein
MSCHVRKFTLFCISAGLVLCRLFASSQAPDPDRPARPPVLIREEIDRPEPARDPAAAEKEIQIGDFYFKRDNFRAAIVRYREAVLSRPDYAPAYEKLIRALEKNKEDKDAYRYMREYLQKFPTASKSADYRLALQKTGGQQP